MQQKFRLFVQRHDNGAYTVTVPGIDHISLDWDDDVRPAAQSLAAHGPILEEVIDDVRQALAKWLARADVSELNAYNIYREEQTLEKVEIELRPEGRNERKRRDKLRLKVSLLVTREDDGQYLVRVPKLLSPQLAFYCYQLSELPTTAGQELAAYFTDHTLEEILPYQHQRQEFLETIEVSFSPVKPQAERKKTKEEEDAHFWALKSVGVNLTARVREGRLLRAYRRDREINRILAVLAAERNNSLLLIGESGVGKTAVVHEIARRIREDQCPAELRERQIWYTSPGHLIAGCMYLGQWQEKLQNLIDEVKKKKHILLMDDVMALIETGRTSKGDDNMAQFLKPYLADGTVVLIGETTPERYRVGENRDCGFVRQFRTIPLEPTEEEATLSILGTVAMGLERQFSVRIEPGANEAALELTRRFQPYRAFPGKAVSLLEQVAEEVGKGSDMAGAHASAAKNGAEEKRPVLSREGMVRAFSRITGLPEFLLSDQILLDPAAVERHFGEQLIGQPDAVQTVVDLITVLKAGLNDPNKPLGSYFFVGPTGVGKTEMAKALAAYLFGSRDRILRFDMSEYAEPYTVPKLIGSALGDQEGELTRRIRLQPFSVLLLDEFEKADPSVFDVLLQVLGEGRLTDAAGRTSDFRSAIILMTSNLGASPREQRKPGLRLEEGTSVQERHFTGQVERFFRPEFVNRLDKVVVFRPLDRDAMRGITARELAKLLEREGVTRRNLLIEIEDEMMDLLLETGFSPIYGARPLKREIEKQVIVPLARYLIANRIAGSQLIRIGRNGDAACLSASDLMAQKQRVTRSPGPLTHAAGARRMDIRELIEGFAAVRLHLHEWAESDRVREIRTEYRNLLAKTRRRNFVSYGAEANVVWQRIYHLERLTRRLDQLKDRAEYMEEFAAMARRERAGRYEADLAGSYAELCRDTDYLEIELFCVHITDNTEALVKLAPLGRTARATAQANWLRTLAKMYLLWADRKGYACAVYLPSEAYKKWVEAEGFAVESYIPGYQAGPPVKPPYAEVIASDVAALLKRLEAIEIPTLTLHLRGTNVFGFLQGEQGVHKLLIRADPEDPSAPFQTATVAVSGVPANASVPDLLTEAWNAEQARKAAQSARAGAKGKSKTAGGTAVAEEEPLESTKAEDTPPIVRLYAPDGNRFVHDLTADIQTTQVENVFDGHLDAFILGHLRKAGQ